MIDDLLLPLSRLLELLKLLLWHIGSLPNHHAVWEDGSKMC